MKILQLTFSLTSGGGEKFAVDLANYLSGDHEVYFCVIISEKLKIHSFFKDQLNPDVKYINLDSLKGINLKLLFTIYKLIKKIKPDVVHFHLNTILYLYIPAVLFRKRINFIHTLHSITSKTIGFKWQKKINKFFYKNNLIKPVVISQNNLDSFIEFYKNDNVILIENGVAIPSKSADFENVKNEISDLKRKGSDKVLIHIGGYLEAKNQHLLVDVVNRLIDEGRNLILIIIGKYFDTDEANELVKNSRDGIYYLGTKTNVPDYLFNSDIFVLSSLWEGLPISLLEALSCGTIPVCTPAGGISGVILNDSIGYVSEDFSAENYYQTISKSLNNIESFDRTKLVKHFRDNYSITTCAKKYERIYEDGY